jgi:hypothetical protein
MRQITPLLAVLLFAACSSTEDADEAVATTTGWIALFDGETTDGWRGYRRDDVPSAWRVVDGALVLEGSGGDLITAQQYGDFVLELEWKISTGGNSGLFCRATEDTDVIYMNSAEVQVLDNAGTGTEPTSVHAAGANYALHGPPGDFAKPAGEWNHLRIECRGPRVVQHLNGQLVCEYDLWSPEWEALVAASKFSAWPEYGRASRGHIGLQDHGNRVAYRNIRLLPLD